MAVEFNSALEGSPLSGYLRFAIPSIVGLLAWSAAPIIDGLFIANFLGVEALAAVNLIIPVLSLALGMSFMIAVGGSVRAGKYIGEGNKQAANNVFSKTLIAGVVYSVIIFAAGMAASETMFAALGAGPSLFPAMHAYFNTILWFLPVEFIAIILYYFVRVSGHPNIVSIAIVVGALGNPILNYIFIVVLKLGLVGAAVATGLSISLMLFVILTYAFLPSAWLAFDWRQSNWKEIFQAAYNGLSEFVDETSAGIVTLALNLVVVRIHGETGVAAFGVVSYSLFIGILFFYGLSEALQAVGSQCYGARDTIRLRSVLNLSAGVILLSALLFSLLLLLLGDVFIGFFINQSETELYAISQEFISVLWPIFIFAGLNILIVGYLTAVHKPVASALIAILRTLILPIGLLFIFVNFLPELPFVAAISLGEAIAFLAAVILLLKHRPDRLFT